jgi:hypothetical protein
MAHSSIDKMLWGNFEVHQELGLQPLLKQDGKYRLTPEITARCAKKPVPTFSRAMTASEKVCNEYR